MKKLTFCMVLCLLFFLVSCTGNSNKVYRDINYYSGSQGYEISFIGGMPPDQAYSETHIPISLEVANKGAFTLDAEKNHFAYLSISTEPGILDLIPNSATDSPLVNFRGKSYAFPYGEYDILGLGLYSVSNVVRESTETPISAYVCYPYKTLLSDEICIDTSIFSNDARYKVCSLKNKVYSNQGAPIAITGVDINMIPRGGLIYPSLLITVENVGSGNVLMPFKESSWTSLNNVCVPGTPHPNPQDQNKVHIAVNISGESLICAQDSIITLVDGVGKIRCDLETGYGGSLNYFANMMITLSYVYKSTIVKEINIVSEPRVSSDPIRDEHCDNLYQSMFNNNCVNNCEICSQSPHGFYFCGSFGTMDRDKYEFVCKEQIKVGGKVIPIEDYCERTKTTTDRRQVYNQTADKWEWVNVQINITEKNSDCIFPNFNWCPPNHYCVRQLKSD